MIAVVPLCVVLFALLSFPKRLQFHWPGQCDLFIIFQDTNRSMDQTRLWLLIPVWRCSGGAPNGYRTKHVYGLSYRFGAPVVVRQTDVGPNAFKTSHTGLALCMLSAKQV